MSKQDDWREQPGPSPLNLRIKTSEPGPPDAADFFESPRFTEDINSVNDPAKLLSPNPGLNLPLIGIKGCASVDEPDSGRLRITCNPGGSRTPDSSTPRTAASNWVSGLWKEKSKNNKTGYDTYHT
ncbi:hypothetical protein HOY80DRAFT_1019373 [Tuber brumale]|nr:hypothetical protein HOY80DRAFT_1019373 [Tuber brumale]